MYTLYSTFINDKTEFFRGRSSDLNYLKRRALALSKDYKNWCAKYGQAEDRQQFIIKNGNCVVYNEIL